MGNFIAKLAPQSIFSQQFPPDATFEPARDMPDLSGKVVIVTGGNSGVGYHTVKQLLLKNAKVYLAARSPFRGEKAAKRLNEETGGKQPILLQLDLADLHSVRKAAEEFLSKEERLDILFNNAGVMIPPIEKLTAQGYDLQFGTNVLGHYFFTMLLLSALERSTVHYGVKARIINTSSAVHEFGPGSTGIELKTAKGGPDRDATLKSWNRFTRRWRLYGASKIGNILVSNILVKHHSNIVVSCAVHPGGLKTDLHRHAPAWQQWLGTPLLYPASYGALTPLWAGTALDAEGVTGKFLIPWARIGKADHRAANEGTQETLRIWLNKQIKSV